MVLNKYWIFSFASILTFSFCQSQKGVSNDKSESAVANQVIPSSPAMAPSTFRAEAEVLSVLRNTEALNKKSYDAIILIRKITGRGSSLTQIVSAGDTLHCLWPTYPSNDSVVAKNISNKKLMEAAIEERISKSSKTTFIIQSYRFK